MDDPKKVVERLLKCIEKIEKKLSTKSVFLASTQLQDTVIICIHELCELSWSITWGYRGTISENAWRRINNLVFQQFLIPGAKGIDRYKI